MTQKFTFKNPSFGPAFQLKQFKVKTSAKLLRIAGPVAIGSNGYDVFQDYQTYPNDFLVALGLTTGGVAAGIVAGALITPAFGVAVGIVAGLYAGNKAARLKQEIIGY